GPRTRPGRPERLADAAAHRLLSSGLPRPPQPAGTSHRSARCGGRSRSKPEPPCSLGVRILRQAVFVLHEAQLFPSPHQREIAAEVDGIPALLPRLYGAVGPPTRVVGPGDVGDLEELIGGT